MNKSQQTPIDKILKKLAKSKFNHSIDYHEKNAIGYQTFTKLINNDIEEALAAIYALLASETADYLNCKESPEQNWQNCTCPNAEAVPLSVIKQLFGRGE